MMQLAAAFQTAEDRLAPRQAATSPATCLRTGRLSRDPKPAVGQQARAVSCRNLSEERTRAEPKAAIPRAESSHGTWRAFLPAPRQELEAVRGTRARTGAGGQAAENILLSSLRWPYRAGTATLCRARESTALHCQQQRTVGNGSQLLYSFLHYLEETKRDPDRRLQRGHHFPVSCDSTLAAAWQTLGYCHMRLLLHISDFP